MLALALPFIKEFMGKFGLSAILGLGLAIGWGLWWVEKENNKNLLIESATKIERAEANTAKVETALEEQTAELNALIVSQAEEAIRREGRNKQLALLEQDLNEERNKNASYEKRWTNVAFKKPNLLARIINRATKRRVLKLETTTCRAGCNKD